MPLDTNSADFKSSKISCYLPSDQPTNRQTDKPILLQIRFASDSKHRRNEEKNCCISQFEGKKGFDNQLEGSGQKGGRILGLLSAFLRNYVTCLDNLLDMQSHKMTTNQISFFSALAGSKGTYFHDYLLVSFFDSSVRPSVHQLRQNLLPYLFTSIGGCRHEEKSRKRWSLFTKLLSSVNAIF